MKYKVLNLYACLGGNRYKWDEVAEEAGIDMEVTAVELDPEAARLYEERFPNDKVIVGDAHEFLIENYKNYDFIWSSPPCPTHSRARYWGFGANGKKPVYPDMKLYEEILFLEYHFKGKWIVENVIPYYEPFLNPKKRNRHLYWNNFNLPNILSKRDASPGQQKNELKHFSKFHNFDFTQYKGEQRVLKMARNLVDYEAGRTIFETALGIYKSNNTNQTELF